MANVTPNEEYNDDIGYGVAPMDQKHDEDFHESLKEKGPWSL